MHTCERPPRIGTSAVVAEPPGRGGVPDEPGACIASSLLDSVQELQDVVIAEPTVTALADPEERELAAVAKPLDGVDVQVQHLGDLGRREKLPDLVRHHWWYW